MTMNTIGTVNPTVPAPAAPTISVEDAAAASAAARAAVDAAKERAYDAQLEEAEARASRGSAERAAEARRAAQAIAAPAAVVAPVTAAPAVVTPPSDPKQDAIDNVIAALAASGADTSSVVQSRDADYSYNSADGSVIVHRAGTNDAQVTDSSGLDPAGEVASIHANINSLQAKLNDGQFDPNTGARKFTLTGDARRIAELQLNQAKESARFQLGRLDQIVAQRTSASNEAALREAAVRAAFIDSAPSGQRVAYAAQYDRELASAKAHEVAAAVMAARRLGGR